VRTIFDEDGNVLSDHEYEPFGNEFFDTKEDERLSWIGKERDKESLLGDFGARKYDFLSGRFTSIDPLWEKYYEWTPYQYSGNNPVINLDPTGLEFYCDRYGNILEGTEIKHPDDPTVYLVRSDNKGNANITPIGHMGGTIDISKILPNIIARNSRIAKDLKISGYANHVKSNAVWDYKNNKSTIFGYAFSIFDKKNKTKTSFYTLYYSMYIDEYFRDAADFGNYHAGFMGRKAGIPYYLLWIGAGLVQNIKDIMELHLLKAYKQMRHGLGTLFIPPFGDEFDDYIFNTKGMIDADND